MLAVERKQLLSIQTEQHVLSLIKFSGELEVQKTMWGARPCKMLQMYQGIHLNFWSVTHSIKFCFFLNLFGTTNFKDRWRF